MADTKLAMKAKKKNIKHLKPRICSCEGRFVFDLVEKCTSANDALPITSQVHTCSNSCGIHVVRLLCFRTGNALFQKLDIIKNMSV